MRLKKQVADINYSETKQFFKNRANKFQESNPYSVTMYQDNNKELVQARNQKEIEKILPLLNLNHNSKVLDIGCGMGRWADALPKDIYEYCGIDFSGELIQIAKNRNTFSNFSFFEGKASDIEKVLSHESKDKFNIVLMVGILMYINDKDLQLILEQVNRITDKHAVICIREPIGIEQRLTLKDFFSEELKDNYNAIYRTREELQAFFHSALLSNGFQITEEGFLFKEDALNNRKETVQYYYRMER